MRWVGWTLAAVVGVAAALFMGEDPVSPARTEIASGAAGEPRAEDDAGFGGSAASFRDADATFGSDRAGGGAYPEAAGARLGRGASAPEPETVARIDEEIRFTEQALAASRRVSDPAGAPLRSPTSGSSEARARAVSRASAETLGCGSSGLACRSSADCCPGLACVGGLAGYGTTGRCEHSR